MIHRLDNFVTPSSQSIAIVMKKICSHLPHFDAVQMQQKDAHGGIPFGIIQNYGMNYDRLARNL